jgi:hypothetical protein
MRGRRRRGGYLRSAGLVANEGREEERGVLEISRLGCQ